HWRRGLMASRNVSAAEPGIRDSAAPQATTAAHVSNSKPDRSLYAAALSFGLALGVHHVTVALILPGLGAFVLLTEGWRFFKSKRLLYCALISFSGLAVYAYLPLAGSHSGVMNWGDPTSLQRIWWHISAKQYQVFLTRGDLGNLLSQFLTI